MATSIVETITPTKAQEYLGKSGGNRNISKPVVASYAASMKAGKWLLNGESITFDIDGVLLNGHHRLHAIILAGVPIQTFVTRGVEHECYTTFDCGRHRTIGQLISMQGIRNYSIIATSVYSAYLLVNGFYVGSGSNIKSRKKSNSDVIDFFNRDRDFFCEIGVLIRSIKQNANILEDGIIGSSIYYLVRIGGYTKEFVDDFFRKACSLDTCENSTIEKLRKRLIKNRTSSTAKFPKAVTFAYVIKTWNAYVTGRELKILKFTTEEEYPKFILKNTNKI